MCVLYVLQSGYKVKKVAGRIVVEENGAKVQSLPIEDIEHIVVGNAQLTTQVIQSLLSRGAMITYIDERGHIKGTLGDDKVSGKRLIWQVQRFTDEKEQVRLTQYVLERKITKQIELIRGYAKRKGYKILYELIDDLISYCSMIAQTNSIKELRGIEGIAARVYFASFGFFLDAEKWQWAGRTRRPPKDPVNTLLSFGYALLEKEVRLGIMDAKLDGRVGFFHSNNGRKDSLVFDLIELFRTNLVDRLVLKVLNKKILQEDDFIYEDEKCMLTEVGRKRWYGEFEKILNKPIASEKTYREFIRKEIIRFMQILHQDDVAELEHELKFA